MKKSVFVNFFVILFVFASFQSQGANLCDQVWRGSVERLRVQEQASGEVLMRLYVYPGNNSEYAGYSSSYYMVETLLQAKRTQAELTGYTDKNCRIKWIDFRQ